MPEAPSTLVEIRSSLWIRSPTLLLALVALISASLDWAFQSRAGLGNNVVLPHLLILMPLCASIFANTVHLKISLRAKRRYPMATTLNRYVILADLAIAVILLLGATCRVSVNGWDIESDASSATRLNVAVAAIAVTLSGFISVLHFVVFCIVSTIGFRIWRGYDASSPCDAGIEGNKTYIIQKDMTSGKDVGVQVFR